MKTLFSLFCLVTSFYAHASTDQISKQPSLADCVMSEETRQYLKDTRNYWADSLLIVPGNHADSALAKLKFDTDTITVRGSFSKDSATFTSADSRVALVIKIEASGDGTSRAKVYAAYTQEQMSKIKDPMIFNCK
jgi:hypothetical protein